MIVSASVPGKLVVLGEYAVLAGAPALVMAVDRYCRAEIGPSDDGRNRMQLIANERRELDFAPGDPSGAGLVDVVLEMLPCERAWRGALDTTRFFAAGLKLGIGSSAAALTAWSAVYASFAGSREALDLARLVELHRRFQGGKGSGLDVAASLTGGLVRYRLAADAGPQVARAVLPGGVDFAVVFSGRSAPTARLVTAFDAWRAAKPADAEAALARLGGIVERGCEAAEANESARFLGAVADYGCALDALGGLIGADIVTAEHLDIARHSERCGVVYKISGAGGGDLGLAFSDDPNALAAFREAVSETYEVPDMTMSAKGLVVEEAPRG